MKRADINDKQLITHMSTLSEDELASYVLRSGNYRLSVVHATRMINQMRANHGLGILETFILGHAYLGAALMVSNLKGKDRIGIEVEADGPAKGFSVEATAGGGVRGYINNPSISLDEELSSFDMAPFIGEGMLSVTKKLEKAKQPYTGRVELAYGNVAQDLANYFRQSEQKPTAFNLSIQFDKEGRVVGAAGLMAQAFPGAEDEYAEDLDRTIRGLPSMGALFAAGLSTEQLVHGHFERFEPIPVGQREIQFYCHCSKERFARFLSAMPLAEIRDIRDNGPFPLKTTCHNCSTTYEFDQSDIEKAYQMAR
jgi:molecular chaperone Hsp33